MMLLRLLQVAATWVVAVALVAGVARLPELVSRLSTRESSQPSPTGRAPERIQPSGISYTQARHLLISAILLVFGLWLLVQFASQAMVVLTLLVAAVILAVALRPMVDRMSSERMPGVNWTMPRPVAIILIYLVLLLVVVIIGLLVVPRLMQETQRLIANFPEYAEYVAALVDELERYPFVPDLSSLQSQLTDEVPGLLAQTVDVVLFAINLLLNFLSLFIVLVLTFFLIMDAEAIHEHFLSLIPPRGRAKARSMTARMGHKIEGWLRGVLVLSVFIGATTSLAMWLLGMPFPLLLGLLAGLFELVPMIGAYLGAAPAVLVALFQPTWKLLAVVAFFFAIQQIENNILAPTVMGRALEMPPLLALVALLTGASLMGIVGALLAVPVAAVLQVLWTDLVVPEIRSRHRR